LSGEGQRVASRFPLSLVIPPPEDALVQLVDDRSGTSMFCRYCRAARAIAVAEDVVPQILLFQELHFGCDPALRGACRSAPGQRSAGSR
jgi:hypothetical protein